jgi:hypothetical protein
MKNKNFRRVLYEKTDFDEIFDKNYISKYFKGLSGSEVNRVDPDPVNMGLFLMIQTEIFFTISIVVYILVELKRCGPQIYTNNYTSNSRSKVTLLICT